MVYFDSAIYNDLNIVFDFPSELRNQFAIFSVHINGSTTRVWA